jgi:hypothetical protein
VSAVGELDEVTYELEVDGELVRRQLHRRIWERRGWATVAVVFEERGTDGAWKAPKLALVRFQRVREAWKRHATVTLRGEDAVALGASIGEWGRALGGDGDGDGDSSDDE